MNEVVIRADGVSKQYRIGVRAPYQTLRERLNGLAAAPWRLARRRPAPAAAGDDQGSRFWALKDVSFEVGRGEVLGIIGRNGAGKSTLLKILSRITEPTAGGVDLCGRVGSLLEVGTGFHPELTGRENVYLNGAILGMKKAEIARRFDEIVAFAEVEKFIDTPVKHYSSGMYMRLAFAVAAHLEPEILIVDEVLAVGDAQFQAKCLNKMEAVSQGGRTVLLVSHNMTAISQLCHRACWIEQGAVKAVGPACDVVQQYSVTFARVAQGDMNDAVGQGDGSVLPIGYRVTNQQGTTTPLPLTNEDILISVRLKVNNTIQQPAYGIEIHNVQSVRMLTVNTVELGVSPPPLPVGEGEVQFRLKKVPYIPGVYKAGFWVMNPQGHIYMMTHADAISFEIGQSPLYGTRDVDLRWGCVYTGVEVSTKNAAG
jgi:lipopolysaccharide transport system ATP-binding protein